MAWTDVLKAVIQNGLARTGYTIKSIKSMEDHWMANVEPITRLFAKVEQFAVSPEGKRSKLLASLNATSVVEALFILKYLYAGMEVDGVFVNLVSQRGQPQRCSPTRFGRLAGTFGSSIPSPAFQSRQRATRSSIHEIGLVQCASLDLWSRSGCVKSDFRKTVFILSPDFSLRG
jgi:hypothetical protein